MTEKQIVVIGGGVVGVCTAYFLAEAGHEVVVVERHHNVAQEASFAHAGLVAPAYAAPWAAPGMPRRILSQLLKPEGAVLLRPTMDRALWRWVRRWLPECQAERYRINRLRMQRIASYSRGLLQGMRETYDIEYEQTKGALQILRTQNDVKLAQPALELLAEYEVPHQLLEPEAARAIEPALCADTEFAAAIHLPQDEAGNCPLFTKRLRHIASDMGVHFYFTSTVNSIEVNAGRVSLSIDGKEFSADAVVVAAGIDSAALLKPLGIHIPMYPVKGYSATAAIKNFDQAPQGTVLDEAYKVAITRLGTRIRVAGMAELGTPAKELHERAVRTLIKVGSDWFPDAANYVTSKFWCDARPMLPDEVPLLGGTPARNVYINLGHGSSGWAMAAGSGKILADLISGRTPEIDMEGLTLTRYW